MITKALLYCTKNKPELHKDYNNLCYVVDKEFIKEMENWDGNFQTPSEHPILNGHVVAVCDIETEEIKIKYRIGWTSQSGMTINDLERKSCVDRFKLCDYLKCDHGYAIHIKKLKVFDEPHKLGERFEIGNEDFCTPKHAPQNMCYCGIGTRITPNMYSWNSAALISIQPQWLVKILNGEKTIEVRKKVLRDMLCQD